MVHRYVGEEGKLVLTQWKRGLMAGGVNKEWRIYIALLPSKKCFARCISLCHKNGMFQNTETWGKILNPGRTLNGVRHVAKLGFVKATKNAAFHL